jgi:hypothetical protein
VNSSSTSNELQRGPDAWAALNRLRPYTPTATPLRLLTQDHLEFRRLRPLYITLPSDVIGGALSSARSIAPSLPRDGPVAVLL